jgi:hypothetical protein
MTQRGIPAAVTVLETRSSDADLAGPRTYLRNCGFDTQLVEVEEDGTIEQNAAFIAAALRKETSAGN